MLGPIVESGATPVVQRRAQVLGAREIKHVLDDVRYFPQAGRTNGIGSDLGVVPVGVRHRASSPSEVVR
jgi:hypothetical protein